MFMVPMIVPHTVPKGSFLLGLQAVRKKVMLFFPFFALFAVGFIFNLSQPWFAKILLFAVLFGVWRLLNK